MYTNKIVTISNNVVFQYFKTPIGKTPIYNYNKKRFFSLKNDGIHILMRPIVNRKIN